MMLISSLVVFGLLATAGGALAETAEAKGARPLRVLFLGNSQLFYFDVPQMVQALAASAAPEAPRIEYDKLLVGGASLKSLWEQRGDRIESGRWDFVVLQEHYHKPENDFVEYATRFHELITRCGARTILLATASVTEHYSADCRFPESTQRLNDMQLALGKKLGIRVAAGGYAWIRHLGPNPDPRRVLDLYAPDKGHPGAKGSYLNACLLYACLTGRDPRGLTGQFNDIKGGITIDRTEAAQMQQAAWDQYRANGG